MGGLLLSIVLLSLVIGDRMPALGWIGPYTVVFIVVYVLSGKLIFQYEKRHLQRYLEESVAELRYTEYSLRSSIKHYSIHAGIVIVCALFLPIIGEGIAKQTGLGQTFVGNIFIAIVTSLPEVVVFISAIRIDAVDLAVGNLFGSNIFNIFILAIDDIFFIKGPLLSFAEVNQGISAAFAIIMTMIGIIGMTYRAERKQLFLAWDALGILVMYVVNLSLLYVFR